jgi:hypothetical protein
MAGRPGAPLGRTDGFVHDNTGGEVSTLNGNASSYVAALVDRRTGDGVPLEFILHGNFLSRLRT